MLQMWQEKKHKVSDCYAKTLECFKCKTRGHMAKICRQGRGQGQSKGQANYVNQDVTCNDPSSSPYLNTCAGNQSGADAHGMYTGGGGALTEKGDMGMCGPEDPLFTPLL